MISELVYSVRHWRQRIGDARARRFTLTNTEKVPCAACRGVSLSVGNALLDDARVAQMAGTMLGRWFPVAKEVYHYVEQSLYLCRDCGHIFIYPVLSDQQTIELIFQACKSELRPSEQWQAVPGGRKDPSIWSTAVRVPSVNDSLRRFLSGSVRVLDVGAHGGEISLNMALAEGSFVDLLQLENSFTCATSPTRDLSRVREFRGLLSDLRVADPNYRADLVLVLHVLEHIADLPAFLSDCQAVLSDDGLLLIEVPYEPHDARNIARNRVFELPHHSFFAPWSLQALLERYGFDVRQLELLNHSHTGVGLDPYTVVRAVCSRAKHEPSVPAPANGTDFCRSLDMLLGSFGGSIAFQSDAPFAIFYYDPNLRQLAAVFETAPGYLGAFTSNPQLPLPNVFSDAPVDAKFLITLDAEDRCALRGSYAGPATVL
jgi:SAM-dependent methyltransferase